MNDMVPSPHDESQPMSLRERKKRLAQTTIEEAALRLFQQRGYEHTSIQDIADAVMMSPRTFFRYFASKEEVLFGPIHAVQSDGIRSLQQAASSESPLVALRTTFGYLASLYQQQRASFLIRYQVAKQTPSIASIYLYAMMEAEPAFCDALYVHLESVTDRNKIRFLVAIYMTAFRVALEEWMENGVQGDLVSLLGEYLEYFSSLSL
ncbi:TetR/AcrR family transcriptional regulator [Dictyobacter arantiisoli]|uniref:TetR family transcriptional regulator n=1 Tax=Dictyobacter arantiisoli TaxID=2014874 RepID=A0A5A5TK37_9CHLR|nr:TetR/AcrR family transcriptional regulator [Dictyobacter arantiisoli]GCF11254.1 TetR family transcriptional regulator [Dictyobacter arantiisoli]